MKNNQMYVITMATGSYDSYSVSVVSVTDDLAKGEAYVNKMNQSFQSLDKKVKTYFSVQEREWQNSHPRPNPVPIGLIAIPKWKGDQKITQEMRNQRKELELKNQEISRKSQEPLKKWYQELMKFREDWANTQLDETEKEIYKHYDENHWYIEEVNWL